MPYNRPALSDLVTRIKGDIDARIEDANKRPRRSVLTVLAIVFAGVAHGLYGMIAWVALQVVYSTSDDSILQRWASLFLPTPRIPATFASGPVSITGTDGFTVEAGSIYNGAGNLTYITRADATITGGVATATVDCQTSGIAGNMEEGATLTLATPIFGVSSSATVGEDGVSGGVDIESILNQRARLAQRLKQPPQGGADFDYAAWVRGAFSDARVWVYPNELGPGTVVVRFMRGNNIPTEGEVGTAQAAVNALRPVTAKATLAAPVATPLDFTVWLSPSTAATQAAARAALADFVYREATPGGTYTIEGINYVGGKLAKSRADEAISLADGEFEHRMDAPTTDQTAALGHIFQLGDTNWLSS